MRTQEERARCPERDEEGGMKLDVIDIGRAYFQADTIREVYVELSHEDWSEECAASSRNPRMGREMLHRTGVKNTYDL